MVVNLKTILGCIVKINLEIVANKLCKEITLSVLCNGKTLQTGHADTQPWKISFDLFETPGNHVLELEMSGKHSEHTQTNDDGEITDDVFFTISRLDFEELDMREIFCQGRLCYEHNFNGSQPYQMDEFYGIIGCNGKVSLEFSMPFFLWLGDYWD